MSLDDNSIPQPQYPHNNQVTDHPHFIQQAKRLWPKAEQIEGTGEWASISYCPGGSESEPYLTVHLHRSRQEAQEAKETIDKTGCGGGCWGSPGHFVAQVDEEEQIKELNARFLAATRTSLPFATLAQALAEIPEEPLWFWGGYIAPRSLTLLAGLPKVGKSTLVFSVLSAMADGREFLGRTTRKAGALVLSEEPEDILSEKVRPEILQSTHVLSLYKATGRRWPEVVRQAVTYCEEQDLSVLVIDTLAEWVRWKADEENSSGAIVEALRPLKEIAVPAGLAVLIVHHQRKSGGEHGTAVRGSSALTGAVDVIVECERAPGALIGNGAPRVLKALSRFKATPRNLVFTMTGMEYTALGDSTRRATAEAERHQIVQVLEETPGATADTVVERLQMPRATVGRHLKYLYEQGEVERDGKGTRGDPYRWKLKSGFDSSQPIG